MAIYRDEQGNIISHKKEKHGLSEAKKKSIKKYNDAHYKTITSLATIQESSTYQQYAIQHNLSMSKLITSCINYCINNNIDISGGVKLDSSDTTHPDETD